MYVEGLDVNGDEIVNFGAGSDSEWWSVYDEDARYRLAVWIRDTARSLGRPITWDGSRATMDAVLRQHAHGAVDGGGFVVGTLRMCPSNMPGGRTEPMRSTDQPCPAGSGGVGGEQVREISAEDVIRINEENKRRERLAAEEAARQRAAEEDARRRSGLVDFAPTGISGRVTDAAGVSVAGASVTAGARTTTTKADGSFVLTLGAGTVDVVITSSGFSTTTISGVAVAAHVMQDLGTVALAAASGGSYKSGTTAPWYKNKWLWIGTGAVVAGGVAVYAISRRRRGH